MRNGSNVKSVSLADGTLSPDLRVNYEFGLVLGVNEFQQEQAYFLQKDYLYNRAFQGYGTVSGLHVTAKWLKGEDVEINVSPGLAIDQFGRPIVVREAQCARLAAWLKKQEGQKKGTIEAHRSDDDERDLRVYIIARYDDYPDGQVPIAGQACNSGDTAPMFSRIHDSYAIDFSWDAPTMPAWDSMRCFAKIMAQVRIRADGDDNDTEDIIEQLRKLDKPGSIPLCAPPRDDDDDDDDDDNDDDDDGDEEDEDERERHWYIPAAEARESLDRIFMVWVTEVRPKLLPDLLDPMQSGTNAQPDILLAHIDFTLDDDWEDTDPKIEEDGFDPPDNGGRPFLLPTQLVQELLLLDHAGGQKRESDEDVLPEREFATIQVRNNHTLYAWVHHPRRLEIEGDDDDDWAELLEVRSNGQPLTITHVTELEPNYFEIRVKVEEEGTLMVPGARVELVFKIDEIDVERTEDDDDDDDETLGEEVEEGLEKVGEVAEKVVRETGDVVEEVEGGVEKVAGEVVEGVGKGVKAVGEVLEEVTGVGEGVEKAGKKIEKAGEKVEEAGEELIVSAAEDQEQIEEEEEEEEEKHRLALGKSIRRLGLDYVGYDRDEEIIIVYTIASHIPVQELVTFFTYDQESDLANMPHTELKKVTSAEHFLALWFHTNDPVRLPQEVRGVRTFVNQQPQELVFTAVAPENQTFSRFWALEPRGGDEEVRLVPGELLTVIFNTNEIGVGGEDAAESLTEVMKEEQFTCVGYDGNHRIAVHHQVSLVGGRREEEESSPTGQLPPSKPGNAGGPTLPFVTVTVTRLNQGTEGTIEAHLELWFHLSSNPEEDRIGFTDNLTFDVLLEDGRHMRTTQVEATSPMRVQHNIYTSVVTLPAPSQDQRGYYMRLRFRLDTNAVNVRGVRTLYETLGEYIRSTGIRFDGYNGSDAIIAYVRSVVPMSNRQS